MNRPLTRTQTRTIGTLTVFVVVLGGLLGGLGLADTEPASTDTVPMDDRIDPDRRDALESQVPIVSQPPSSDSPDDARTDPREASQSADGGTPEGRERGTDAPHEARDGLTDATGGPESSEPESDAPADADEADEGDTGEGSDESDEEGAGVDDTTLDVPLPDGALEPDLPGVTALPDISLPSVTPDCDADHFQGTWLDLNGTGTSGDILGMDPFVYEDCEGVVVEFGGDAPDAHVERHVFDSRTVVQFQTEDVPGGPVADDHVDFAPIPGQWTSQAYVVHEGGSMSVVLYHPGALGDLGARVDISGQEVVISVRERGAGDPEPFDFPDDGTHTERPRGPVHDGLVLDRASTSFGTRDLVLSGYAKAPESSLEMMVYDPSTGRTECVKGVVVPNPSYVYGRYEVVCEDMPPGSYDVLVGWPSPTDDPADGQWYTESVTVRR